MLRLLALGTTGRPASLTDGLPGDGRGTPARPRRTSRGCDEWGGEGTTPTTPPMTASRTDSARNCVRIWAFVAPRARRRPSRRETRPEL